MNPRESTPPQPVLLSRGNRDTGISPSASALNDQAEDGQAIGLICKAADVRQMAPNTSGKCHETMQARSPHQPRRHAGITNLPAHTYRLSNGDAHDTL